MKLIVGLGNPGPSYEKTRHNGGFMVVEAFFKDFEPLKQTVWTKEDSLKSDIARIAWQPQEGTVEDVILAKPLAYMNHSGIAVELIASRFLIHPSDIWVVHDDIDIPLGKMKIRLGGASAGHKGVEDIMNHLNTDRFWRFRMGIGEPNSKLRPIDDFVLGTFRGAEKSRAKALITKGRKALSCALEEGMERAMNRFNAG